MVATMVCIYHTYVFILYVKVGLEGIAYAGNHGLYISYICIYIIGEGLSRRYNLWWQPWSVYIIRIYIIGEGWSRRYYLWWQPWPGDFTSRWN